MIYQLHVETANAAVVHVDSRVREQVHVNRKGDGRCADYVLSSRYPFTICVLTSDGQTICRLAARSVGEQLHLDL